MTKYKQYFKEMWEENSEIVAGFQDIHDKYQVDRKTWSQRFHQEGQVVIEIIRDYERRLCSGMEKGKNSVYSARLAEKFWAEVKLHLPLIERVGVKSNLD